MAAAIVPINMPMIKYTKTLVSHLFPHKVVTFLRKATLSCANLDRQFPAWSGCVIQKAQKLDPFSCSTTCPPNHDLPQL